MPETKILHIPKELQDFVQNVSLRIYDYGESSMILPSGKIDIVLQKEFSFYHKVNGQKTWNLRPKAFVGGLHDQLIQFNSTRDNNELLVITLHEGKGNTLFNENAFSLFNTTRSIRFNSSQMSIFEAANYDQLEMHHFLKLVDKEPEDFPINHKLILSAIEIIKEHHGFISISKLSDRIGFSLSHFRKLFREIVGCSPSVFCRLIRVKKSLQSIKDYPKATLTDIAHQQCYADQSHFIKDFKKVTRLAPNKFLKFCERKNYLPTSI
ncbi:MAG: helix-turn-helix domain-containing protein [Nonlabens sp.]